jgi:phosphatidylglycerol lysyltransferase
MGEEAVVALQGFSLEGPARKKLRTTYNRALRDGLSLEILDPPHAAGLMAEVRAVSDAWLAARGGREKRFSVGRFDPDYLQRFPLVTVRLEGRVVAFANLLAATGRRAAAVDLMRHRQDAPGNAMEFLFTALLVELAGRGFAEFSLGMTPLAGLTARRGSDLWTRFGALVYRRGDRFYNFEGLRRFKSKFDPEWRPRYLCCRSILPPVAPLADAALLIAGSARGLVGGNRQAPRTEAARQSV